MKKSSSCLKAEFSVKVYVDSFLLSNGGEEVVLEAVASGVVKTNQSVENVDQSFVIADVAQPRCVLSISVWVQSVLQLRLNCVLQWRGWFLAFNFALENRFYILNFVRASRMSSRSVEEAAKEASIQT